MKPQYRIRNWSEYNAGLKARGSLTFWIDEAVLSQWIVPNLSGKPGASPLYSDLAILTMATLKVVYRLAGRQTQGFLASMFELMGIDWFVPEHSTLSRRMGKLSISMPVMPKAGARHLVVDSTGVMFRFKTIFGGSLSARKFDNQAVELFIKCAALNRMIQLAKPDSYVIEA
jgi:hypothetical protein